MNVAMPYLSDDQQDSLRRLRFQSDERPAVDDLIRLGLAEPVPTDSPDYHATRLTSAGRRLLDESYD